VRPRHQGRGGRDIRRESLELNHVRITFAPAGGRQTMKKWHGGNVPAHRRSSSSGDRFARGDGMHIVELGLDPPPPK
jgi:hypothetical protein